MRIQTLIGPERLSQGMEQRVFPGMKIKCGNCNVDTKTWLHLNFSSAVASCPHSWWILNLAHDGQAFSATFTIVQVVDGFNAGYSDKFVFVSSPLTRAQKGKNVKRTSFLGGCSHS